MLIVEPADRVERKRRGAWYTPPALVDLLVDQAVVPALEAAARRGWPAAVRVLDPACGDGRLLAAAAEEAQRRGAPPGAVELVGIELDGETAEQARRTVPSARIVAGDGRAVDPGGCFDAIIGNPPYLGQLTAATSRGGRSRLGGGPYADVAAEFLLRAVELARPDGGRVALVLPQSVLATRDTEAIRATVRRQAAMTGLWWAGTQVFAAGVHVCVVVLERGRQQGPVVRWRGPEMAALPDAPAEAVDGSTWAPLVADAAGVPPVCLAEGHGCLGDLATATAGFRQHFYGLAPFVTDDGGGPPLVTTGLIDLGRCAWGERPARFDKRRFSAPRVDLDALGGRRSGPRGLGPRSAPPEGPRGVPDAVIEAAVDEEGTWIPSVPVVSVRPAPRRGPVARGCRPAGTAGRGVGRAAPPRQRPRPDQPAAARLAGARPAAAARLRGRRPPTSCGPVRSTPRRSSCAGPTASAMTSTSRCCPGGGPPAERRCLPW